MTLIQLTAVPEGPYRLEGAVKVRLDRDGQPLPERGSPVALCRHDRWADEPSCDGSHARTGWRADA